MLYSIPYRSKFDSLFALIFKKVLHLIKKLKSSPVSNVHATFKTRTVTDRRINTCTESNHYVHQQEGNGRLTKKMPNSEYCPDDLYHTKLERVITKSK